jgi:hypothetical protein
MSDPGHGGAREWSGLYIVVAALCLAFYVETFGFSMARRRLQEGELWARLLKASGAIIS